MLIRRRNAEPIRIKRQSKSCKRTEAIIASSVFQYLQILIIWGVVIAFDMLLDLRLEFVWPCWLLIRSTLDTYRCSGLLFALFFLTVALASDIVVYLFLPLHWILFIGSSFVWLQLAFQTERGICLPTVVLCLVFLYVEFAVRFRDHSKMFPVINQILRPLAAHCIGYPIVTIGFHIKAFVSGKLAQRNKLRVRECNHFYFDLVDQALPEELRRRRPTYNDGHGLVNGRADNQINGFLTGHHADEEFVERINNSTSVISSNVTSTVSTSHGFSPAKTIHKLSSTSTSSGNFGLDHYVSSLNSVSRVKSSNQSSPGSVFPISAPTAGQTNLTSSALNNQVIAPAFSSLSHLSTNNHNSRELLSTPLNSISLPASSDMHKNNGVIPLSGITPASTKNKSKDESSLKLEAENKKLKCDLQASRSNENELRSQVQQLNAQERATATELQRLRQENENVLGRVHSLTNRLNEERNKLQTTERKLTEEKRFKTTLEGQLEKEKKARKEEVESAKVLVQQATAQAVSAKNECSDSCKQKRREIDSELKNLRRECRLKDDKIISLENELDDLRKIANVHNDLVLSRDSLRDQQLHLSEKLREENKFKQDLLTAYHEAKRDKNRLELKVHQLDNDNMQLRSFFNSLLNNPPSPSLPLQYGYNSNGGIARSNSNVSCLGSLSSPSPPLIPQLCGNGLSSDSNNQLPFFSSQNVSTSILEMPPTPASPSISSAISMSSCISPASMFSAGSGDNGFVGMNNSTMFSNPYATGPMTTTTVGGYCASGGSINNNQLQSYSMVASTSASTPSSSIISTVGSSSVSNNPDLQ